MYKIFSTNDWQETLSEYRGGVDYPISFFYKEIMEAFPNAKVKNIFFIRLCYRVNKDGVKVYLSTRGIR